MVNQLGVIFPDAEESDKKSKKKSSLNVEDDMLDELAERIAFLVARKLAIDTEASDIGVSPNDPAEWFKALKENYKKEVMDDSIEELEEKNEEDDTEGDDNTVEPV